MLVEKLKPGEIKALLVSHNYIEGVLRAKMVLTSQGEFLKFFYDVPGIHRSSLKPKAKLFTQNSETLNRLGFVAPNVTRLAHCPEERAWMVIYKRLPGDDLRVLGNASHLEAMPEYLARLHQKGVYFRGIHLGNVLFQGAADYALIDTSGMAIWPMPLTIWQRLRNLGRLLSFPEDVELFETFGVSRFCDEYCAAAGLVGWRRDWLTRAVTTRVEAELRSRTA